MSFRTTSDGRVQVCVDGCTLDNGSSGTGVWFNFGHHLNEARKASKSVQDNNDAELEAAKRAIDIARSNISQQLLIYTDSEHVMRNRGQFESGSFRPVFQRVSGHDEGIKEAHKLARKGAEI